MHKTRLVSIAITLCLLTVVPREPASTVKAARTPANHAPGEVIVKLKRDARELAGQDLNSDQLLSIARTLSEQVGEHGAMSIEPIPPAISNQKLAEIISKDRKSVV